MTVATLQALVRDVQAQHDDHGATLRALIAEIDALIGERVAMADTLRTFYAAPLSMSSVQPIIDLAVALNPSLRLNVRKDADYQAVKDAHASLLREAQDTYKSPTSAQDCGCEANVHPYRRRASTVGGAQERPREE